MKLSDHPKTCAVCHGSGVTDGEPIWEIVNGERHAYTTVRPCTHHWTDDNPDDTLWPPPSP